MLTLLLDEHIAPIVAEQAAAKVATARIISIHRWQDGAFLNTPDEIILEAAYQEKITLVTFDQSTIRPVLKEWGEQGRSHGGVIFIDCLLYTSDAADERSSVDLGGRRI